MHIFIAVTYDKVLTAQDLEHYLDIAEGIDGLLFRTSMPQKELKQSMIHLMNQGFAKDK
ncbi:thiamine phosphate synthase, partial [Lentilactobacillus parakefiri]